MKSLYFQGIPLQETARKINFVHLGFCINKKYTSAITTISDNYMRYSQLLQLKKKSRPCFCNSSTLQDSALHPLLELELPFAVLLELKHFSPMSYFYTP